MGKLTITFILFFSLLISCDRNTRKIYMDCLGEIEDIDNITDLSLGFTANVTDNNTEILSDISDTDSSISTVSSVTSNSVTPIQINRYSHIYVYKQGNTPLNAPYLSMGIFRSETAGSLTAIGWPITLSRGIYDLYSAGSNYEGSDQGPDFFGGIASNLAQDVDYFWWKQLNVTITTSNTIVPITYSHSCAQIIIDFSASGTNTLNKLSHVDITLGNTIHCNLSLQTGYISPSKSIPGNTTMMRLNGLTATVVSLPIAPASTIKYLTATINATVNNQSSWYTLKVPLPPTTNAITGGNSYIYSAVFGGTKSLIDEDFDMEAKLERIVLR